jgi:hypothetical protein
VAVNQMTHHQSNQGGQPPAPVKPPRKNPYRDGISKSNQQYDLYEAIRHPNRSKSERPPLASSQFEKPLSKQKLLEKEVYEKFKKNNFRLPGANLKRLGKLFKMLFLLIALPIYMILYRMPRWVFVELLPAGIKKGNKYFTTMERYLVNYFKKCCHLAVYPFTKLWNQLKFLSKRNTAVQQESGHQETGFFAFIAMGIWLMVRPLYRSTVWVYRTSIRTYNALKSLYFFLKLLPKRIQDYIQGIKLKVKNIPSLLRLWVVKRGVALKNFFSLKPMKAYFSNQLKQKAAYIKGLRDSIYKACALRINHGGRVVKNYVNSQLNRFKKKYEKVQQGASSGLEAIYTPIKTSMMARDAQLRLRVKEWRNGWQKRIKNHKLKESVFSSYIHRINKQIKERYSNVIAVIQKRASQTMLRLWKPVALWIDKKMVFVKKGKQLFLKCIHVGEKGRDYIFTSFNSIKTKWFLRLKKYKPVLNLLKKQTAFMNRGLVFVAGKVNEQIRPVRTFLSSSTSKIILDIRITIAWTTVLLRYGMTVLGQTALELGWF